MRMRRNPLSGTEVALVAGGVFVVGVVGYLLYKNTQPATAAAGTLPSSTSSTIPILPPATSGGGFQPLAQPVSSASTSLSDGTPLTLVGSDSSLPGPFGTVYQAPNGSMYYPTVDPSSGAPVMNTYTGYGTSPQA